MSRSVSLLSDVPEGRKVRVRRMYVGKGLSIRLYQMGIVPGEEVVIKHNNRGFIVLEVRGAEISLSRGIASKIEVEYLPNLT